MDFENRNKLIKKEINSLLIKFHKGESLGLTSSAILQLISTVRFLDEKKISYVLHSLKMSKRSSPSSKLKEAQANMEGYNEAVEQNNFAVNLSIDSFKELNDEEK